MGSVSFEILAATLAELEVSWQLRLLEPTTEDRITAVELALKTLFPKELKEFLLRTDGIYIWNEHVKEAQILRSLSSIEQNTLWPNLSFKLDINPPKLLAIAEPIDDLEGENIVYLTEPWQDLRVGIYHWTPREDRSLTLLADNLQEYFNTLKFFPPDWL